jgi:hypothetical protein
MKMRKPIITALLHPINLSMLALAAAAGLCSAWWLFPLGLLLWLLMVIVVARDPSLQIRHTVQSRTPLARRFQSKFDRIERLQVKIFNAINSANSVNRRVLQPVMDDVSALTDQAYKLCQRSTALENYRLVSEKNEDLESEWVRLSKQVEGASDLVAQREYQQSLDALERRLGKHRQAVAFLDRIDAQMEGLASSLQSVLTEVIRLQAIGEESVRLGRDELLKMLQVEESELRRFEVTPQEISQVSAEG